MRPRVLLDIDGVVCDFLTPFLMHINAEMGTSHKLEDMTDWNMYTSFNVPDDVRSRVDKIVHSPGYCTSLQMFPGSFEGVQRLIKFTDVFVVTSPWTGSPTWEFERRRWVFEKLGLSKHVVISTKMKHVCSGDYLIDDKTKTLMEWSECHPDGIPIRWAGPANKMTPYSMDAHGRMGITVSNWDSAIDLIKDTWSEPKMSRYRRWHHG